MKTLLVQSLLRINILNWQKTMFITFSPLLLLLNQVLLIYFIQSLTFLKSDVLIGQGKQLNANKLDSQL